MAITMAEYCAILSNLATAIATGFTSVSMATSMYSLCSLPASARVQEAVAIVVTTGETIKYGVHGVFRGRG